MAGKLNGHDPQSLHKGVRICNRRLGERNGLDNFAGYTLKVRDFLILALLVSIKQLDSRQVLCKFLVCIL